MKLNTKQTAATGLIAALYIALTLLLAPISFGAIQFRLSELL
ncbi:MAG: QueT transporter family protein, partial [Firmicutes bacterium]|nr:QueT transporter family protein [Bacillota bacterium]